MSLPRAFTALSGAQAVTLITQIVRGKLAAVLLGPAGVGIYNQLTLMWNLFNMGGSLGSFIGMVQSGSEVLKSGDERALRQLVSTFTLLLGSASCLCALAGVVAARPISDLLLHDAGRHADLVALILVSIPIAVSAQIYRALLSSARAVSQLVRAQIWSDFGGALIFAALILPFGIRGAILGFMATHFLYFLMTFARVRRLLGREILRPSASQFSWSLVRRNLGFGINGMLSVAIINLSIIAVSRIIIAALGLEASGIFANSWRVASVYLGAVTAATLSYYLPTLTRCETTEEMSSEVNGTVRFYLYVLPLLMAIIMSGGEVIVWLVLSSEFQAVAPLLLVLVPAELIRIIGEAVATSFLAKGKALAFTLLLALQGLVLVLGAYFAVPNLGLFGAAYAYAGAAVVCSFAGVISCRRSFHLTFEARTIKAFARAVVLLSFVSIISFAFPLGFWRVTICGLGCSVWIALTIHDEAGKELLFKINQRWPIGGVPPELPTG